MWVIIHTADRYTGKRTKSQVSFPPAVHISLAVILEIYQVPWHLQHLKAKHFRIARAGARAANKFVLFEKKEVADLNT